MSNFINRRFKNFKFINEKYKPEIIEKLLNSQNKSIKFYTKLKHVAEWFLSYITCNKRTGQISLRQTCLWYMYMKQYT